METDRAIPNPADTLAIDEESESQIDAWAADGPIRIPAVYAACPILRPVIVIDISPVDGTDKDKTDETDAPIYDIASDSIPYCDDEVNMADLRILEPAGDLHDIAESDVHSETWHLLGATPTAAVIPVIPTYCPSTVTNDVAVEGKYVVVSMTERTSGFMKDTAFTREPYKVPTDTTVPYRLPVPIGINPRMLD
jgi:hypothetical protein